MTEDARATAYREQVKARLAWERENAIALRGTAEARASLNTKWQPLLDALREMRHGNRHETKEEHSSSRWSG